MVLPQEHRSEFRMFAQRTAHQRMIVPEDRKNSFFLDREMRQQMLMVEGIAVLLHAPGSCPFGKTLTQFPAQQQPIVMFPAHRLQKRVSLKRWHGAYWFRLRSHGGTGCCSPGGYAGA